MKKVYGEQSRRRGGRWSTDGTGEGKEGASPSGYGKRPLSFRITPRPRRGTANLNRCAETAAPQKRGRKIMGRRNCWEATGQNLIQMWVIWTGHKESLSCFLVWSVLSLCACVLCSVLCALFVLSVVCLFVLSVVCLFVVSVVEES